MKQGSDVRNLLIALMVSGLAACAANAPAPQTAPPATPDGMVLMFSETQPDAETGTTRMLVNSDFLRIDEGPDSTDFILFDRRKQVIYNVVADDHSILVIPHQPANLDAGTLHWQVDQEESQALPRTQAGAKAVYYRYRLNDRECNNVVAVEGLLPAAVKAMREYRMTLAGELSGSYLLPLDEESLCDAAVHVIEPLKALEHGFPVREWRANGFQRFLTDYRTGLSLPPSLFTPPADYRRYSIH